MNLITRAEREFFTRFDQNAFYTRHGELLLLSGVLSGVLFAFGAAEVFELVKLKGGLGAFTVNSVLSLPQFAQGNGVLGKQWNYDTGIGDDPVLPVCNSCQSNCSRALCTLFRSLEALQNSQRLPEEVIGSLDAARVAIWVWAALAVALTKLCANQAMKMWWVFWTSRWADQ